MDIKKLLLCRNSLVGKAIDHYSGDVAVTGAGSEL